MKIAAKLCLVSFSSGIFKNNAVGFFANCSDEKSDEDVKALKRLCEAAKVQVMSPLFEVFSIDQIVIESFDFPFTSGPNNQAYTIGAVSDDIYKLLLREEDLKVQ